MNDDQNASTGAITDGIPEAIATQTPPGPDGISPETEGAPERATDGAGDAGTQDPQEGQNAGETGQADDYVQELERRAEELSKSLRAVSAERNQLRRQLQDPGQPESAQPAQQQARSQQAPSLGDHKDAGKFIDPMFAGMPYDPNDDTICIGGDPGDARNWVAKEVAAEIVSARQVRERLQQEQQKQFEAEMKASLRAIEEPLNKSITSLREAALPFVTDKDQGAEVDKMISSLISRKMFDSGIRFDQLVAHDPAVIEALPKITQEAVMDVRKIFEKVSTSIGKSQKKAADTEPVAATGTATAPAPKSPAEMSSKEHRNYLEKLAEKFFGS